MKLLVSDYDGTFKSDIRNLCMNIRAVNRFMSNGNKFVISTGRSYNSIKREISIYKIKYDYLVCNNGLVILDNNDNIINYSKLDPSILKSLLQDTNPSIKCINLYDIFGETIKEDNVIEVCKRFKDIASAKEYMNLIVRRHPFLQCTRYNKLVYLSNYETKATSIKSIINMLNLDENNVYTVGNDRNDLSMLQAYNGYKVLYSNFNLWFKNINTTREVHTLIKKIDK